MNILITICARGGSKGVPGKNIKPLNGKPLIGHTIELAQKLISDFSGKIGLSTDSCEIKRISELFDLNTNYQRPDLLASDGAGKIDAIRDLLNYEEQTNEIRYDYILDLDVTSPLRTISDVSRAFEVLNGDAKALTIFSVNPSEKNPYFNMVEQKANGYFDLVKSVDESVLSRQKAPKVYDLNASFYWYKRSFFDSELKSPITNTTLIFEMDHICFDIDSSSDFDFMEYLIENNKVVL